ncbi:MAG: hypothetical protein EPN82_04900 [Bacteroidetes bacterium]|nr:MAG: hypothetical protein EPN82_04900 [Bacteroidota bacterium]
MKTGAKIFEGCKKIVFEENYSFAKKWKKSSSKRVLIGIIPNYFPREIIHAANGLAVGIIGAELKHPENNFKQKSAKSACSMLEGIFDLVKSGKYKDFDGFILPSQCLALSGFDEIQKIKQEGKFIKYINFPQYFQTIIGDILNHYFVSDVLKEIYKINKVKVTSKTLNNSIQLFKENLKLTERIFSLRKKGNNNISQGELYYTVMAGLMIPIENHNEILMKIIELLGGSEEKDESIFKVYAGAYC